MGTKGPLEKGNNDFRASERRQKQRNLGQRKSRFEEDCASALRSFAGASGGVGHVRGSPGHDACRVPIWAVETAK